MGDNLKEKMIGALAWSSVDRFGQQVIQFLVGIMLARLLFPSDYGLIGMVMVFAALSFVFVDSGFYAALIRKKNTSEVDYNSVFYLNLTISVFLYVVFFFAVPYIAGFFNQPELVSIGRVTFFAVIFNAFYLVPFAQLGKKMNFRMIARINIFAIILSGVLSISLALSGKGVWALVAQQTGYHFFRMVGFFAFVRWKPRLLFSLKPIRKFWNFSVHILGTSLLTVIFNNLYTFLLGKFYHVSQVGYYTQAHKMSETSNFTFQAILNHSTYNLFVQIYHDEERLVRIFKEIIKKVSLIVIPVTVCLIVIAKPLFFVLLSEKWLPAVPYFQLLCLGNLFAPLYLINNNALNAKGKSNITFRIELVKWVLIIISILVCFNYGIMPLLGGYAAACMLAFLFSLFQVKKELNHSYVVQLKSIFPGIFIGLLVGLVGFYSCLIQNQYLLLAVQAVSAIVLYYIILKVFFNDTLLWIQQSIFSKEKSADQQ